tara:strand:+ start:32389 stop:32673 length:285 start_codon:yes stop_codon:yes gene_type:complete
MKSFGKKIIIKIIQKNSIIYIMIISPLHPIVEEDSNQSSEAAFISYNSEYEEFKNNEIQENSLFTKILKGLSIFLIISFILIIIFVVYYHIKKI